MTLPKIRGYALAIAHVLLAACSTPEVPEPDASSLRTLSQGEVLGYAVLDRDAHGWRGLPFAQPPLGSLRWRAPQPPAKWHGTREALESGSMCTQFSVTEGGALAGSEDCLYLDVFAPRFASSQVPEGDERLPVMVWIHGGGNTVGAGDQLSVAKLAAENRVIVVTLNYRLGVFGWFAHPALRATASNSEDASGNFGTLDLIRGLEWVRENVSQFGGNPNRVTIFGESAGGINVFSLLLSPRARGLFHGAIAQSGIPVTFPFEKAENYVDADEPGLVGSSGEILLQLIERDGRAEDREAAKAVVASMSAEEISGFLRDQQPDEILSLFDAMLMGGMYFVPNVFRDGTVVRDVEPLDAFANAEGYNAVPVILGTNRDESKLFLAFGSPHVARAFGMPLWVKDQRRYDLAGEYGGLLWKAQGADDPATSMRNAQGPSVFGYRFDWDEEGRFLSLDLAKLLGAAHAIELLFVFGTELGRAESIFFDDIASAKVLSAQMRSYWAQFAYASDPGRGQDGTLPEWTPWGLRADEPKFMRLDSSRDRGLSMASDTVTERAVVAKVASDPRLENAEERCEIYAGFLQWSDALTREEYEAIGDGACRDFPVENVPGA